MALPLREKLAMLMPPSWFYRRRIAQEIHSGEPELAMLAQLLPRGGTAVDVGANQGLYAFALADIADRTIAFEPNPDYAAFANWMLRGRAEVRQLALSDRNGRATFTVPFSDDGVALHLAGNINGSHAHFRSSMRYEVEVRALDSFDLSDVRFVKVDVEGSERDVLDGARVTIARDRPILLLELLSGVYADPHAVTADICREFGYDAYVVQRGEKLPALPAIAADVSAIESRNVLFLPRR